MLDRFKRCFNLEVLNNLSLSNKIMDQVLYKMVDEVKLKHYDNLSFQKEYAYNMLEYILDCRSLVVYKLSDCG